MKFLLLSISVLCLVIPWCSGHSLSKIELKKAKQLVYTVQERKDGNSLTISNPDLEKPSLREIIYYHIIEKPFKNSEERNQVPSSDEAPDFDETRRPFTNGHGYQFLPDDNEAPAQVHDEPKLDVSKDIPDNEDSDSIEFKAKSTTVSAEPTHENSESKNRQKRDISENDSRAIPDPPTLPELDLNKFPMYIRNVISTTTSEPETPSASSNIGIYPSNAEESSGYNDIGSGSGLVDRGRTYGMDLTGNGGTVWNNLYDPNIMYHVGRDLNSDDVANQPQSENNPESTTASDKSSPESNESNPSADETSSKATSSGSNESPEKNSQNNSEESGVSNSSDENSGSDNSTSISTDGDVTGSVSDNNKSDENDSRTEAGGSKEDVSDSRSKNSDSESGESEENVSDSKSQESDNKSQKSDSKSQESDSGSRESDTSTESESKSEESESNENVEESGENNNGKNQTIVVDNKADASKKFDQIISYLHDIFVKGNTTIDFPTLTADKDRNTNMLDLLTNIFSNIKNGTEILTPGTKFQIGSDPNNTNSLNVLQGLFTNVVKNKIVINNNAPADSKRPATNKPYGNEEVSSSTNSGNSEVTDSKNIGVATPASEMSNVKENPNTEDLDETSNKTDGFEQNRHVSENLVNKGTSGEEVGSEQPKDQKCSMQNDKNENTKSELNTNVDQMSQLMNNEKFWTFMGNLGAKYLDSLTERTTKFIKEEVAAQVDKYFSEHKEDINKKLEMNTENDQEPTSNEEEVTDTGEDGTEIRDSNGIAFDEPKRHTPKEKSSVHVKAHNVYGNTVGNDKVTNVYVFYASKNIDEILKNIKNLVNGNNGTNIFTFGVEKPGDNNKHEGTVDETPNLDENDKTTDLPTVTKEVTEPSNTNEGDVSVDTKTDSNEAVAESTTEPNSDVTDITSPTVDKPVKNGDSDSNEGNNISLSSTESNFNGDADEEPAPNTNPSENQTEPVVTEAVNINTLTTASSVDISTENEDHKGSIDNTNDITVTEPVTEGVTNGEGTYSSENNLTTNSNEINFSEEAGDKGATEQPTGFSEVPSENPQEEVTTAPSTINSYEVTGMVDTTTANIEGVSAFNPENKEFLTEVPANEVSSNPTSTEKNVSSLETSAEEKTSAEKKDSSEKPSIVNKDSSLLSSAEKSGSTVEKTDTSLESSVEMKGTSAEEKHSSEGPSAEKKDTLTEPSVEKKDSSLEPSGEKKETSGESKDTSAEKKNTSGESSAEKKDLSLESSGEKKDTSGEESAQMKDSSESSADKRNTSGEPSGEKKDASKEASTEKKNTFAEASAEKKDSSAEKKNTSDQPSAEKKDESGEASAEKKNTSGEPFAEKKDTSVKASAEQKDSSLGSSAEKRNTSEEPSAEKIDASKEVPAKKTNTSGETSSEKKDSSLESSGEKKDTSEEESPEKEDTSGEPPAENKNSLESSDENNATVEMNNSSAKKDSSSEKNEPSNEKSPEKNESAAQK